MLPLLPTQALLGCSYLYFKQKVAVTHLARSQPTKTCCFSSCFPIMASKVGLPTCFVLAGNAVFSSSVLGWSPLSGQKSQSEPHRTMRLKCTNASNTGGSTVLAPFKLGRVQTPSRKVSLPSYAMGRGCGQLGPSSALGLQKAN